MLNFWQRWGTRGNRIYTQRRGISSSETSADATARAVEPDGTATTTDASRSRMTDWLPDSDYVARPYCPLCEPDRDPCAEVLETRYCGTHQPSLAGEADHEVTSSSYLSGSAEVGGEDNAKWGALVHRGQVVPRVASTEGAVGERVTPPVGHDCC